MRNFYHISFSSHEEVMFRSEADLNYAFNCFALACLETDSRPLADSEMTTHVHFGVATDSVDELFSNFRYKYTRFFNSKYGRNGKLGERKPFVLEVAGMLHLQTMLSYVLRQGLHHGLSSTPFGYKYSSVNAIFKDETGKYLVPDTLSRSRWFKYLPCNCSCIPSGYRMTKSGLLFREDVIDTKYVEEIYVSARNFIYHMNRLSNDKWKEEQNADNNGMPPVTLVDIEPGNDQKSISQMLINENGRNISQGISDLDLCRIIDSFYLDNLGKDSIYSLTDSQKAALGNSIYCDIRNGMFSNTFGIDQRVPDAAQIRRCLAISK